MGFDCAEAYWPSFITGFKITIVILVLLADLVAVVTSIVILFFRKKSERPVFVVLSTMFLIVYCTLISIYLAIRVDWN